MGRRGWALTIVFGLVGVALLSVILLGGMEWSGDETLEWQETQESGWGSNGKLVQLFVDGVIAEQSSFGSSFSAAEFLSQLEQARRDSSVKAVVIRINSPGGEVVASDDIHRKIIDLQEAGKRVVVSMGAMAASGGYYIAAPADRIFASPATLTGSLGVIMSMPNYEGAAEKIGYRTETIQSGDMKDIGSAFREMTEEERAIMQDIVDESYEQFVDVISEGRGLSRARVYELADGRVYTGKQAQRLGLIDELGTLEEATAYAAVDEYGNELRVIRYDRPFSWSQALLGFQQALRPSMADIVAEIAPGIRLEPGLMYLYTP